MECHSRRHESGGAATVSRLPHGCLRPGIPGVEGDCPAGTDRPVADLIAQQWRPRHAARRGLFLYQEPLSLARPVYPDRNTAGRNRRDGCKVIRGRVKVTPGVWVLRGRSGMKGEVLLTRHKQMS